ncbi:MAG: hypothetical protein LQ340_005031 [Diploschistes diacapsis]|nr:MAG: hypothetical protein LQ340_005031 [Diploschistes diacapsis]
MDRQRRRSLWRALEHCAEPLNHPLLLPIILTNNVIGLAARREFQAAQPIARIKNTISRRERRILTGSRRGWTTQLRPSRRSSQKSFYEAQSIEWRCKCHAESIAEFRQDTSRSFARGRPSNHCSSLEKIEQQSEYLGERMQNLRNTRRDILEKTEYFREPETFHLSNLSLIREDFGNLISRSIAEATKQDSEAMR